MNRDDTVFLKFIAICLVLNSHLDAYYPIDHIGTGGAIGNVLFFVLSSLGLLLSEQRKPQLFSVYLTKRIKRIYPSVWLVLIFIALPIQHFGHINQPKGMLPFFIDCLIPPFWFLKGLLVYYFVGFFLIKRYNIRKMLITMGVVFAVYLYWYLNYLDISSWSVEKLPFKYVFYMMVFLFGIFIADFNAKIKYAGIQDIIIGMGSIFILYGHKLLMAKQILLEFQIIQQLILFILVLYAIKISRSSFVLDGIMQVPVLEGIIRYVASITLELYIVHTTISAFVLHQNLAFPMNTIVFLSASFLIAAIIKRASTSVLRLTNMS